MVIIGDNLRALVRQQGIVANEACVDQFSITLHLDEQIVLFEPTGDRIQAVTYGESIPEKWLQRQKMLATGYAIPPQACFLGCSSELVKIPDGYIGFVQTKGSLARLFVQIQCCDAQVEPGFSGRVTFEVCNHAAFPVRLKPGHPVAQMFLVKTSTKGASLYNGRYQGATGPTVQREMGLARDLLS